MHPCPLSVKPGPPLPACSKWRQIVRVVSVSMSEWWNQGCQSCGSEARSKASCQLIANTDSVLPAKPYPPLPDCSQRSQFHPTSEARSTCTSLLPANSDCQRGKLLPAKPVTPLPAKPNTPLPARPQRSQIHCYQLAPSEANFFRPAKPDPPAPACSQRGQIVRVVSGSHRSQFDPFKRSQFHPTSEARSTSSSLLPA